MRARDHRTQLAPLIITYSCVAAFIAVGPIPVAAGADGTPQAVSCQAMTDEEKTRCYQEQLESLLRTHGTEHALDVLVRLTTQDPDVLREAHNYAHHLGRQSFGHYQDATVAFSHCRDTFWSGCYHGVLEAYLRSLPQVQPQDIAQLCGQHLKTGQSPFLEYQCLHGLGHGLTMYFHHDVPAALAFCDALPAEWEQNSCYGGVFMENIVAFQNPHHAHHHGHQQWLNPQDPLYPCTAVDKRYQQSCYLMQSSAILTFTDYDFARAFKECARAPAEFVPVCYQSLGRDISGFTLRDPEKVLELCSLAQEDAAVQRCFVGAVKDFIMTYADSRQGLALCRRLPETGKNECYTAAGELLTVLYPEPEKRAQACAGAEEPYIGICKAAARVS